MKEERTTKRAARRTLVVEWGCAACYVISFLLGIVFPGTFWEVQMCLCFAVVAMVLLELVRQFVSKEKEEGLTLALTWLLCIACIAMCMTLLSGATRYVVYVNY